MLEKIHLLDSAILASIQKNLRTPLGDILFSRITLLGNYGLLWLALAVFLFAFKKTGRPRFHS